MVVQQLDPYKVQEIRTLGKQEDAKARDLLEQVAKQVQPIMRRWQLSCPLLLEFYPRSPALAGLNVGGGAGGTSEIKIRLRRPGQEGEFFHYEHILGTMLHELVHNLRSPHDARFYKLLDELTEECEELMSKGISGSGAGFDAPAAGTVAGRFVGRDLPQHQRKGLALKAAMDRARKQAVMPGGPQRVGGDLSLRQLCNPREAAAIAAERRASDNLWCPAEQILRARGEGQSLDTAIQHILSNGGGGRQQQQRQPPEQQQQQRGGTERAPAQPKPAGQGSKSMSSQGEGQAPERATATGKAPSAGLQQQEQRQQQQQQEHQGHHPPPPPFAQSAAGLATTAKHPSGAAARVPTIGAQPKLEVVDLTADDSPPLPPPSSAKRQKHVSGTEWGCPACTLQNRQLALACAACGTLRPAGFY